jgi:hypothetical protein
MQSGAAIIDHDEDSSKAQEPPRRGHTSLPIATEKDGANLTNPAKEKQSSPETPPPLPSQRDKILLQPLPEEAPKLPPLEKRRGNLTLDDANEPSPGTTS